MNKNSNVSVYMIVDVISFLKGGFGSYNGLKLVRIEKVNSKKKVSIVWREIEIKTESELIHKDNITNVERMLKNA